MLDERPVAPAAAAAPVAAVPATVIDSVSFAFHGTGSAFFALMLKNILLTLVTLGGYLPWARTERRKYLWQNVQVQGHRLRYHGTGKELMIGYLKVLAAYALFVAIPIGVERALGKYFGVGATVLLSLSIVAIIPAAIWGSRRYLLSRTSWRGIHFRLEGDAREYTGTFFKGYLFTILTLGFYGPIWMNNLHRISTTRSALGTQTFRYSGDNGVVWRMAMKGFLLSLLTLGFYYFWYQAALTRYQLEQTWFADARGELRLTGGDLLKLTFLQIFGLTFSLGLAFPWIATYTMSYTLERLRFVGRIDLARIYQGNAAGDAAADGLADALDVGAAL